MEMQAVAALVIGTLVVLFVPALVWATVIAGLYQTARAKTSKIVKTVPWKTPAGVE
jgi:hypothetical protein